MLPFFKFISGHFAVGTLKEIGKSVRCHHTRYKKNGGRFRVLVSVMFGNCRQVQILKQLTG